MKTGSMAPCRRCGTQLARSEHRRLVGATIERLHVWDDDDQRRERRNFSRPRYENIPCPKCGDPAPLLRNKPQLIIFFAVMLTMMIGLFSLTIFF